MCAERRNTSEKTAVSDECGYNRATHPEKNVEKSVRHIMIGPNPARGMNLSIKTT
jgi:hypothetical protein